MNNTKRAIALSAGLMTAATGAMAAETAGPAAPPQTHDLRAAELPPIPGWYGAIGVGIRDLTEFTNNNGDAIFPDTKGTQTVYALSAMYVMPEMYRGGRLAFLGVATLQDLDASLTASLPSQTLNKEPTDLTLGVIWSKAQYEMPDGPPMGPPPGRAFALGLETVFPIGDGSQGSIVVKPNIAYTYRTAAKWLDGTEVSGRLSYNHVTERTTNHPVFTGEYKDGDYLAFDFAVTERYRNFQFGLAGTYMKAIQDDKPAANYTGPTAGRMEELALGAVLNVDLGPTSAVKMKYTKGVKSKNLVAGDLFQIAYIRKF